ncbi:unnamed protein product [Paramecium octaurelia]|uniref:Uncharacterized protein n=1 Tax=Paramecium octaurelia TaxID=43137 RepID=A0A8S1YB49_PAROT|nr:unnamed protein product [Paramecium octaurelia]
MNPILKSCNLNSWFVKISTHEYLLTRFDLVSNFLTHKSKFLAAFLQSLLSGEIKVELQCLISDLTRDGNCVPGSQKFVGVTFCKSSAIHPNSSKKSDNFRSQDRKKQVLSSRPSRKDSETNYLRFSPTLKQKNKQISRVNVNLSNFIL